MGTDAFSKEAKMVWNREMECATRDQLEALQLRRLQAKVAEVYEKVPFYREAFRAAGVSPKDVRSLDDLAILPFTRKSDFRDHYPFGLLAVPLDDVVRVHASSGTTGKMTVVAYTAKDIDTWAEVMARTLSCGEVTRKDVVHNAYGYGLFTGGLGFTMAQSASGQRLCPCQGVTPTDRSRSSKISGLQPCAALHPMPSCSPRQLAR